MKEKSLIKLNHKYLRFLNDLELGIHELCILYEILEKE